MTKVLLYGFMLAKSYDFMCYCKCIVVRWMLVSISRTVLAAKDAVFATEVLSTHKYSTVFTRHKLSRPCPAKCSKSENAGQESAKSPEMTVTEVSEEKEREDTKREEEQKNFDSQAHRESDAARTLQRTYRGYKSRRELQGFSLDPSTRWTEVHAALSPRIWFSQLMNDHLRLSRKRGIAPSRLLVLVQARAFHLQIT